MNINRFLLSSFWYAITVSLGYVIVFFGNIIFTHLMSQEYYGLYNNYYSIVALMGPFVGANLFVGVQNGFFDFKEDKEKFRASILFLSFLSFISFSSLSIIFVLFVNTVLVKKISLIVLLLALLHAYSFFIINFYNVYENLSNHFKAKSVLLFLQNFVPFALSLLIILGSSINSYYARIMGSMSGLFIISVILFLLVLRKKGKLINTAYFKYALRISVPSIFGSVSSLLMQNSDNIMITSMAGAATTAVYGFMYQIGNVLLVILSAIGGAVSAWIYTALDSDSYAAAKRGQKWYFTFFIVAIVMIFLCLPDFIRLVVPAVYWDYRYMPPFIMACSLYVINHLYGEIITFHKRTGTISLCVFLAALCNVFLNFYFIKRFGAIAAAYTSFVSCLVQTVLYRIIMRIIARNIFSDFYSIVFFIAATALSVLFLFVYDYGAMRYILFSSILLALCIFTFKNRNEIKQLVKA